MITTGIITILSLTSFITAPYGRHSKSGWGMMIDPKIAWFIMEVRKGSKRRSANRRSANRRSAYRSANRRSEATIDCSSQTSSSLFFFSPS